MSGEKFTKGEWRAEPFEGGGGFWIKASEPPTLCHIAAVHASFGNAAANARLICASPIMFDFIRASADKGDANAKIIIDSIIGHTH